MKAARLGRNKRYSKRKDSILVPRLFSYESKQKTLGSGRPYPLPPPFPQKKKWGPGTESKYCGRMYRFSPAVHCLSQIPESGQSVIIFIMFYFIYISFKAIRLRDLRLLSHLSSKTGFFTYVSDFISIENLLLPGLAYGNSTSHCLCVQVLICSFGFLKQSVKCMVDVATSLGQLFLRKLQDVGMQACCFVHGRRLQSNEGSCSKYLTFILFTLSMSDKKEFLISVKCYRHMPIQATMSSHHEQDAIRRYFPALGDTLPRPRSSSSAVLLSCRYLRPVLDCKVLR